ncbi:MAG: copper resistance protein CopC [Acidimicrobiales bacterium]
MGRSVVRLFISGLLLLLTVGTVGVSPAFAHGQLLQASPGPGQKAGGVVDFIDLAFLEDATDAVVAVTKDGVPVPGTTTVGNGRIVRFQFDPPLSAPGRYDVTFTATWLDQDRVTEAYYFTYDAAAPAPAHIGSTDGLPQPGGGWSSVKIVATVVLITALFGLAVLYVLQLERRRSRAVAEGAGGPGARPGRGGPADQSPSRRA